VKDKLDSSKINSQDEKLEVFRAILMNSATRRDAAEEEREYFLNLAHSLTALHIRILKFMADPRGYLRTEGIPENSIQGSFSEFFPVAIPGVSVEVIRSAMHDLFLRGLTGDWISAMTMSQGMRILEGQVQPLGRRFIEFCTLPG
jgi:hypothetical protein